MDLHLHSHDCERLEQKRQSRLAASKTCIQKSDTGDDEPDQERHHNQVQVVELKSLVLSVDILDVRVAAIRLRLVEFGLQKCQCLYSQMHKPSLSIRMLGLTRVYSLPQELP